MAAPPLRAPWTCGATYEVSQAHNTGSHVGKGSNAWDFALPVGTTVVAPANGVVRMVRQNSSRYGCSPAYAYDANYVIIAFKDGTEALMMHLQANSVVVKVGDHVKAGEPIGKIGMSGYTCGPHLHFQVQRTCNSWWCTSVPANFAKYADPYTGEQLVSTNCTKPADQPQMASNQTDKKSDDKDANSKATQAKQTKSSPKAATGGGEAAEETAK